MRALGVSLLRTASVLATWRARACRGVRPFSLQSLSTVVENFRRSSRAYPPASRCRAFLPPVRPGALVAVSLRRPSRAHARLEGRRDPPLRSRQQAARGAGHRDHQDPPGLICL